jgi:hypothetical protein
MSENFEDRYEDSFKSSGFSIDFTGDTVISSGNHSDTISCYGANDILGYLATILISMEQVPLTLLLLI